MEQHKPEKNLELERLVFFSDAVVAIAITLLALDLRIERATKGHLTFADIGHSWKTFVAFGLSFVMIAIFWKIHHQFFIYVKKIDARLLFYNLGWLLFIVTLPFSTTLISAHFFDIPAIFIYSVNIFAITCFQNLIWDYVSDKPDFVRETLTADQSRHYRIACNLAMGNAILAIAISFLSPVVAFFILFTRTLMFQLSAVRFSKKSEIRKNEIERRKQLRDSSGTKKPQV